MTSGFGPSPERFAGLGFVSASPNCMRPPAGLPAAVRRRLALHARPDEARLHPAQEGSVLGQHVCDLRLHATVGREALRRLLQGSGGPLDHCVAAVHRFTGGGSPVRTR